jgi:hypothetical protein
VSSSRWLNVSWRSSAETLSRLVADRVRQIGVLRKIDSLSPQLVDRGPERLVGRDDELRQLKEVKGHVTSIRGVKLPVPKKGQRA